MRTWTFISFVLHVDLDGQMYNIELDINRVSGWCLSAVDGTTRHFGETEVKNLFSYFLNREMGLPNREMAYQIEKWLLQSTASTSLVHLRECPISDRRMPNLEITPNSVFGQFGLETSTLHIHIPVSIQHAHV